MKKNVRVRFAPSPTGPLHIGGLRTALFNYLFAKQNNGEFLLRIEDTDRNRYLEHAEQYILDALDWCNISIDEGPNNNGAFGPYRQSERLDIYKSYAMKLVAMGKAYYAFDTNESLNLLRQAKEKEGESFVYNWQNRMGLNNSLALDAHEVQTKLRSKSPYVIRFIMHSSVENKPFFTEDMIREKSEINIALLDDKIIFKSDGYPTYHLANVIDDHLMNITHVIRGEEWLPSLALHKRLYEAFNWEVPEFAHLPLILKPNGKGKLSKRDGDAMGFPVFPLTWKDQKGYKENGFLSEAVVNFLALLGWHPDNNKEVFSLAELISAFDLKNVVKGGAKFDYNKAIWFNHQHIQRLKSSFLEEKIRTLLIRKEIKTTIALNHVINLIRDRLNTLDDLWDESKFFFIRPNEYDEKAKKKVWKENTKKLIEEIILLIEEDKVYSTLSIKERINTFIHDNGLKMGMIMGPLRIALIGEMKGPDLFEIIKLIGRDETIKRLDIGIKLIK